MIIYYYSAVKIANVFTLQVMVLGDSGVGKTCLLVRFRDNTFLGGNYISTVGVDFRVRRTNSVLIFPQINTSIRVYDYETFTHDTEILHVLSRNGFMQN